MISNTLRTHLILSFAFFIPTCLANQITSPDKKTISLQKIGNYKLRRGIHSFSIHGKNSKIDPKSLLIMAIEELPTEYALELITAIHTLLEKKGYKLSPKERHQIISSAILSGLPNPIIIKLVEQQIFDPKHMVGGVYLDLLWSSSSRDISMKFMAKNVLVWGGIISDRLFLKILQPLLNNLLDPILNVLSSIFFSQDFHAILTKRFKSIQPDSNLYSLLWLCKVGPLGPLLSLLFPNKKEIQKVTLKSADWVRLVVGFLKWYLFLRWFIKICYILFYTYHIGIAPNYLIMVLLSQKTKEEKESLARYLLQQGADPNAIYFRIRKAPLNKKNLGIKNDTFITSYEFIPTLYLLAKYEMLDLLKELVSQGADLNKKAIYVRDNEKQLMTLKDVYYQNTDYRLDKRILDFAPEGSPTYKYLIGQLKEQS